MKLEFDDGSIVPLKGTVMRAVKTSLEIQKNGMGVLLSSPPQEYDDFIKDLYKD
jgi:hypothetical protein